VHQIDINNVFLHGDLQETVYTVHPPSFHTNDNTFVYKLKKAIYGQKLSSTLLSFGFTPTKSDSSLFIKIESDFTLFVLIYVDDILITRTSSKDVSSLILKLRLHFDLMILVVCTISLASRFHGIQTGLFILCKQNTYVIFCRKLTC